MIPEPCPACRGQMQPVEVREHLLNYAPVAVAMKCFRCNIRFDLDHPLGRDTAIREWNDLCRRFREQPFQ